MTENLVNWFTTNLSGHLSKDAIVFIISMIPILELRGGMLAAFSENQHGKRHCAVCHWKYYSSALYPAVYHPDFQLDEGNQNFQTHG